MSHLPVGRVMGGGVCFLWFWAILGTFQDLLHSPNPTSIPPCPVKLEPKIPASDRTSESRNSPSPRILDPKWVLSFHLCHSLNQHSVDLKFVLKKKNKHWHKPQWKDNRFSCVCVQGNVIKSSRYLWVFVLPFVISYTDPFPRINVYFTIL